jgi:thiol:disulfide interchange protein
MARDIAALAAFLVVGWTATQVCTLAATRHAASHEKHAAGIQWYTDYAKAQAEDRRSHKVVMVDFYTSWCGWCKKLDSDVYPKPSVIKAAEQFVPTRLDAEKSGSSLAARYKVDGYPTIIFVAPSGKQVGTIVGYEEPAQFTADLNRIAKTAQSGR